MNSGFQSWLGQQLDQLKTDNLYKIPKILESPAGGRVKMNGKEVINLASNNYLGLANHPKVKQAALDAIEKWGVGAGAGGGRERGLEGGRARGVEDGAVVGAFNPLGETRARARLTPPVPPGGVVAEGVFSLAEAGGPTFNALFSQRLTDHGAGSTFSDNRVDVAALVRGAVGAPP
jgi:hypothetical protein